VPEVVILGSGSPNPDPGRAGAATAVIDGDAWVLVDCGRGATQRAIDAGLDLTRLVAVLLTHHHSDHVSDLATLATARWAGGGIGPLRVVAPTGPAAAFARGCLDGYPDQAFHSQADAGSPLRPAVVVDAFAATDEVVAVHDADGFTVASALVDHHPVAPAVGYRIGISAGVVVVSGDTAACAGMAALAAEVDVLVHEALLGPRVSAAALTWNAGADEVGRLAAEAGVGRVVLTHLIPAPHTVADIAAYEAETRRGGWTGPLTVAHDLLRIPI
jgi:ribonuclease Z